jgi:hypothetical protein
MLLSSPLRKEDLGPLGIEALGERIDDLAEVQNALLHVPLDLRFADLVEGLVRGGRIGRKRDRLFPASRREGGEDEGGEEEDDGPRGG